jgi:hypothetical protein
MYKLGDTISNKSGERFVIIMTFFVSKNVDTHTKDKSLGGFWACTENMKSILPFYLDKNSFDSLSNSLKLIENVESPMQMRRSRCLLTEKDFNIILQKKAAKKFASILLKHL